MGETNFKVTEPDGTFLVFSLDRQVSHVLKCPDCNFVVGVYYPFRAAGHGVTAILDYKRDADTVGEIHLTDADEGTAYECARCKWPFVRAKAIRERV